MAMRKSCDLLERGSVNFTPVTIDACCFGFDSGKKGSPNVTPFAGGKFPDKEYFAWREAAIARVEAGDKTLPCTECPQCVERDWPDARTKTIAYLMLTPTTACQLDCKYCWSVHNGTKDKLVQTYDVVEPVKDLIVRNLLNVDTRACIGGGEPTLLPSFDKLFSLLCKQGAFVELPTNAVKLSTAVINGLKAKLRIGLITSLDCGTKAGFVRERGGKDYFDTVVSNLQKYYEAGGPELVSIKYIATYTNSDLPELEAFVKLVEVKFKGISVKLDADIRAPLIDRQLYALAFLQDSLRKLGNTVEITGSTATRLPKLAEVCETIATGTYLVNKFSKVETKEQPKSVGTLMPSAKITFGSGFHNVEHGADGSWVCWAKQFGSFKFTLDRSGTLSFKVRTGHFPLYKGASGQFTGKVYLNGTLVKELVFTEANLSEAVVLSVATGESTVAIECERAINAKALGYGADGRDLGLLVYEFKLAE